MTKHIDVIKYLPIGDCLKNKLIRNLLKKVKSCIDHYVMNKVRSRRLQLNISQSELAKALKMSVGFIGKVESPSYDSHYNIKHINKLAKILKCSPRYFMPHKTL